MKDKKFKTSLLISAISIAICIGCLTGFGITYSWIKRNWAPEFYANEMTVETGGSLAIQIANDNSGNVYDKIDLTRTVIGTSNFSLKQVSNLNGDDDGFFGINYDGGDGNETLQHISMPTNNEDKVSFAADKGFIWARFQIQAQDTHDTSLTRYVFIDSYKSYIRLSNNATPTGNDASEAIRCSLSIEGLTGSTMIFKKNTWVKDSNGIPTRTRSSSHYGAREDSNGQLVYANPQTKVWNETTGCAVNNINVYEFWDFNGGFPGYNDDVPVDDYVLDPTKTLFPLDFSSERWIIFRLWLEGYDRNTTDSISGAEIDFKLVFRAHEVQNTSN